MSGERVTGGGYRRQRALLDYALGAFRRRGRRNLAMIVGLTFVVGLYASVLFLTESLRHEWHATLEATPDLVVQRLIAGRPALLDADETFGVEGEPGVRELAPRVWGYLFVEAIGGNVTIVASRDAEERWAASLASGRNLRADAEVPEVLVGEALADRLGVRASDRLAIPDAGGELHVLEVAGVFDHASAMHSADVMVTTPPVARALLDVPEGKATDIALTLARAEEAPAVARRIREALPGARVIERSALVRTYELTFDGRAGFLAVVLLPCLAAFLLLAWDRLTGLGDMERREIGILKAIGWETRDVLTARLWESATIAFGGVWIGCLLAYGYVYLLGAPGLAGALFGWSALHPTLELTPAARLEHVASLIGLVVLPFVGVSLVPAWRAATLDPDEAMR